MAVIYDLTKLFETLDVRHLTNATSTEENSMVRSLFGFSIFAIVAIIASKLLFGLLGVAIGLVGKLLWLAFLGWLFYLVLKLFAPETASKVKETITGKPA
jgi:small-conductance mechanosensitive channel